MQTEHDVETTFDRLVNGRAFRFHHRDEPVVAVKASFPRPSGGQGALILTPSKQGLHAGDILHPEEVGSKIVELADVVVAPSAAAGSVIYGAGHFALPSEIELHDGDLIFVTMPQGGSPLRVNLRSGIIGRSTGGRPTEIYSEWSVVRKVGERSETLYAHKPVAPKDESIVVEVP